MKRFFENFEAITQFTRSLDYQDTLECAFCFKSDQFVSHGIVYKQRSIAIEDPVGRRIFCSNRYGRSGCGRTFQLYVADEIPSFHYGAAQLFAFIHSLFTHLTLDQAYEQATGQIEPRNAWRWLNKLSRRLCDFRRFLCFKTSTSSHLFKHRPKRLQILLPTLLQLFGKSTDCPCSLYQLRQQSAFI